MNREETQNGSSAIAPWFEQALYHVREMILIAERRTDDPLGPRIVFCNPAAARLTGYTADSVMGRPLLTLCRELAGDAAGKLEHAITARERLRVEVQMRSKAGESLISLEIIPLVGSGPEPSHCLVVGSDISQQKRDEEARSWLQDQLFRSQKLETIGVLASGVAHDFNNILTGIVGSTELIKMTLPQPHPAHEDLENIMRAAQRAAALTRELLVYASSGKGASEVINLNQAVTSILVIMRSQMSRSIIVRKALMPDVPNIEADAVQVQQVMLNLCLNASEAMKDHGGVLTITTDRVMVDSALARECTHLQPEPGLYAVFEVSDTGMGMDSEQLKRIFTPFFTTKPDSRGLGLAVVYDIVKRHSGGIQVVSEPGEGTTVRVLLPATRKHVSEHVEEAAAPAAGTKTILFVDDEEVLRSLAQRALERFGYRVLLAADGIEAVRIFKEHAQEIDLVVLDLSMPRKGGEDAFQEMHAVRDDMKILLCCGYNEAIAQTKIAGKNIVSFLPKPFGIDTLVQTVQSALSKP